MGNRPTKEEFMKQVRDLIDKLGERDLHSVIIMARTKEDVAIGMVGSKDELFDTARDGVLALMGAFLKMDSIPKDQDEVRMGLDDLMKAAHFDLKTPTDPKQIN